jgi:transcriptional regulator with XRE-family HTH domain
VADDQQQKQEETERPLPVRAGIEDAHLAANIRDMRIRLGLSQGELGRRMADLDWPWYQQTVRRAEEGTRKLTAGEAAALARIFDTSLDRLLQPSGEASLAALIEQAADPVHEAWDNIFGWTAALTQTRQRLYAVTEQAGRSSYRDSPLIARLLGEARETLALTAESAVTQGLGAQTEQEGADGAVGG